MKILSIKHEKDLVFLVEINTGETKRCDFRPFFEKNKKHPTVQYILNNPELLHNPWIDETGTPCWGADVYEPTVDLNPDNIFKGLYDYVD